MQDASSESRAALERLRDASAPRPDDDATRAPAERPRRALAALPGVGHKTVALVLLFDLGRAAMRAVIATLGAKIRLFPDEGVGRAAAGSMGVGASVPG